MWFFFAFCFFLLASAALVFGIAFPRVLGLSRRLHAVGLLVAALVAFGFSMVRRIEAERRQREADAVAGAEAAVPTLAEEWLATIRYARLDETTINQFYARMPAEEVLAPTSEILQPGWVRIRWTFDDDSYIEAVFRSTRRCSDRRRGTWCWTTSRSGDGFVHAPPVRGWTVDRFKNPSRGSTKC